MPAPSLFLNDFTVLDFAFVGAIAGLQGDSYYVSAELTGSLDAQDFLLDFSAAKKTLKALVDDSLDHKLLVPAGLARLESDVLRFEGFELEAPRTAFEILPGTQITVPLLEAELARRARAELPANVETVRFRLSSPARFQAEEQVAGCDAVRLPAGGERSQDGRGGPRRPEASFRYTHGLRYHTGNCQRLFHGHRNPVEVWVGGARSPAWEARLAAEWDGAHFVAVPTLQNLEELDLPLGQRRPQHAGVAEVAYESSQGAFRGRLPASRVVLTSAEPSIETMSALALSRLADWGLKGAVRVVAYEGLNKGAAYEGCI